MKIFKTLLLGMVMIMSACTSQENFDVYLLIGQSNMAGRGTMIAQDTIPIEGVYLLNDSAQVEEAVAPLNKYSTIRKDIRMQQVSLANNFSAMIHQKTGKKVLLVVNARGGSSIKSWSPNKKDNYTDKAIERTRQALKYGTLKGILWHQGETDTDDPMFTEYYMDSLKVMVSYLRQELDAEQVPFVAGEIAPWVKNSDKFNPLLHSISSEIPYSAWVTSEGCSFLKDEIDPHFSRDGQMLLGKRYAEAIYKMYHE